MATVPWPRTVGGRTAWVQTPVELLPPGWQSLSIRQPMRLASCEEVDCFFFLNGWTEVFIADGNVIGRPGQVDQETAAGVFGLYGPREIPPTVVQHPPGVACHRIHKRPAGPPLFVRNGSPVGVSEFNDRLGAGLDAVDHIRQRGL